MLTAQNIPYDQKPKAPTREEATAQIKTLDGRIARAEMALLRVGPGNKQENIEKLRLLIKAMKEKRLELKALIVVYQIGAEGGLKG